MPTAPSTLPAEQSEASIILQNWKQAPPPQRQLDRNFIPKEVFTIPRWLAPLLVRFGKINSLIDIFEAVPAGSSPYEFCSTALKVMNITFEIDPKLEQYVPKEGPVVFVCNHPFGGVDGIALLAALLPLRPELKILINVILGIFPDLRPAGLPLDVLSGTQTAAAMNTSSLRAASSLLKAGGSVAFFPSGTVSHWQRGKGVVDPDWQITAARLAKRYEATVVPLFFHGKNSLLFNLAGMIHPMARTLMLPRELARRVNSTISLSVGRPVEPATLRLLDTQEAITAYMRMRCYALENKKKAKALPVQSVEERPMEPVADAHDPDLINRVFAELPEDSLLMREGDYAIYSIRGGQSPLLLEELGSLRERTFRLVGEGSGKSRDLDIYDERYHHLLLWHEKDMCLVGAYRLGKVQEILKEQGPSGLYTTTLFRISSEFFTKYANSLELGRAVVHPKYQREYAPLMLLWKGIGRFVLRHKDVHCLFGPVSLSLDYAPASLRTAVDYLQTQCGDSDVARMVKGRTVPDKLLRFTDDIPLPDTLNYNGLVALVRDIEGGNRGIPILFKHYLKLGGKIAAFHMDTSFNTLDAFLLMDLVNSPQSMLERYMTPQGAEEFLNRWRNTQ